MNNSFIVSYEKLSDEHITSYLIGFHRNDIKDILIQFLKLSNKKIEKIKFFDEKKSAIAELINKNEFILILDDNKIPLSQNDVEVLTAFLLDATEEYIEYDHIDFEIQTDTDVVDVCFMRI